MSEAGRNPFRDKGIGGDMGLKDLVVWENSSGMMFIGWRVRMDSVIYPDEPGNLKAMADFIGVDVAVVKIAVQKYKDSESRKKTIRQGHR